jgi:hypothetical protein
VDRNYVTNAHIAKSANNPGFRIVTISNNSYIEFFKYSCSVMETVVRQKSGY